MWTLWVSRRSPSADGGQCSLAGFVHRELAIERGQLKGTALRSDRARDRELAPAVVKAPERVEQQGDSRRVHQRDGFEIDHDGSRGGSQRGVELRGELDAEREIEFPGHGEDRDVTEDGRSWAICPLAHDPRLPAMSHGQLQRASPW